MPQKPMEAVEAVDGRFRHQKSCETEVFWVRYWGFGRATPKFSWKLVLWALLCFHFVFSCPENLCKMCARSNRMISSPYPSWNHGICRVIGYKVCLEPSFCLSSREMHVKDLTASSEPTENLWVTVFILVFQYFQGSMEFQWLHPLPCLLIPSLQVIPYSAQDAPDHLRPCCLLLTLFSISFPPSSSFWSSKSARSPGFCSELCQFCSQSVQLFNSTSITSSQLS